MSAMDRLNDNLLSTRLWYSGYHPESKLQGSAGIAEAPAAIWFEFALPPRQLPADIKQPLDLDS